ncbi:MAG: SRPBCC domain-containing protein [Candidatus Hydrothermarchaeaceae archaeon]
MPNIVKKFRVKVPLKKAWDFLGSRENLGSCVSRCKVKIINENDAEWRIDIVLKTFILFTHITKLDPPNRAAWYGRGQNIKTVGSVELKAISKNETEVTYKAILQGSGVMKGLIDFIIERKLDSETEKFINCVRSNLE